MKKTSKEIIAEAENLKNHRDTLAKKLTDLRASAVTTAKEIQERAGSISDALLNGASVEESTSLQTKEKEKLEGLKTAVALGEKVLVELDGPLTEAQRDVQHLAFDPVADEVYMLALACIEKLHSANADCTELDQKFKALRAIAGEKPGIPLGEHLEGIERMYQYLRAAGTQANLAYKLNEIETNFPSPLREARSKQGK